LLLKSARFSLPAVFCRKKWLDSAFRLFFWPKKQLVSEILLFFFLLNRPASAFRLFFADENGPFQHSDY